MLHGRGGLPWETGENRPLAGVSLAWSLVALAARDTDSTYELDCMRPGGGRVVGKERFLYDFWGDTVNVASRLESSSAADGYI